MGKMGSERLTRFAIDEVDFLPRQPFEVSCEREGDGAGGVRGSEAKYIGNVHLVHLVCSELLRKRSHRLGSTRNDEKARSLPVEAVWDAELVGVVAT